MKYFFIAGEPSGDTHASHVIRELHSLDAQAEIRGMGGDKMRAAGMQLDVHFSDYSFMGFIEVVKNLRKVRSLLRLVKETIKAFKPDKVVFVDYGGFNLKMAKFCKSIDVETHFYILPKVWAWNEKRVKKIKAYVDFAYCIFPFEEDYFRNHGVNAFYVGNPVAEQIDNYLGQASKIPIESSTVALLPGSRKQEIKHIWPEMLAFARSQPNYRFKLAAYDAELFENFDLPDNVKVSEESTYDTLRACNAAIVTSGTATLETALLNVPQVVCYKGNELSVSLAKRLVKIKFISPVNLILDKLVIKELIQSELNTLNLADEVLRLFTFEYGDRIKEEYAQLRTVLGSDKSSARTAELIYTASYEN